MAEADGLEGRVILHIYDVTTHDFVAVVNDALKRLPVGTGAFHGAVQVYGMEWSYGFTAEGSGVFYGPPKECPAHRYRESIDMGVTPLTEFQVAKLMQQLEEEWLGGDYDLLRHNCCSFCNEFCIRLQVGPIPAWVTNLAGAGATLQEGALEVVSAGKAAMIIAAAKAGEVGTEVANVRATDFLQDLREKKLTSLQAVPAAVMAHTKVETVKAHQAILECTPGIRPYKVKDMASTTISGATAGVSRAKGELFQAAWGDEARVEDETLPQRRPDLMDDPFLNGPPESPSARAREQARRSSGGAGEAASGVNQLLGRFLAACTSRSLPARVCW